MQRVEARLDLLTKRMIVPPCAQAVDQMSNWCFWLFPLISTSSRGILRVRVCLTLYPYWFSRPRAPHYRLFSAILCHFPQIYSDLLRFGTDIRRPLFHRRTALLSGTAALDPLLLSGRVYLYLISRGRQAGRMGWQFTLRKMSSFRVPKNVPETSGSSADHWAGIGPLFRPWS